MVDSLTEYGVILYLYPNIWGEISLISSISYLDKLVWEYILSVFIPVNIFSISFLRDSHFSLYIIYCFSILSLLVIIGYHKNIIGLISIISSESSYFSEKKNSNGVLITLFFIYKFI